MLNVDAALNAASRSAIRTRTRLRAGKKHALPECVKIALMVFLRRNEMTKLFGSFLVLVSMIMNSVLGYQLVNTVLPDWFTFWVVSTIFVYLGLIFSALGEKE